ncbi:MAG: UvrD-helicase domain-containing protein [Elusimicrobia bacterium]|nr:UvrD-helicase domain-containing protein [Elusimicrobiota bacterium]MDE2237066.1 UvrD-helicase domain-containing protein [Elusimicrobiota bacterium]MDE2426860.1 UvrD-helicase domain-containing protein [Elusimicrobiota bacterium]
MPVDLEQLNAEQRAGATQLQGPLLVLAGAGTGKTRVITYRIARLIETGVPPERILAVTFTNKAAGELRRRIDELAPGSGALVWAHTFHAFACRLLRQHHEALGLPRQFTIYDQSDQKKLVAEAMKELRLDQQANKAGMYVSIISRAKDDLLDAGSYAIYAAQAVDASRQQAARVYGVYQKKLEQAGALDFGDLLLKLCLLLKENAEVRERWQQHFLHVLVDEYQDTNHAQYVITKTLAAKHRNLCVVGDDDQSVYSWRGANIRNILEFERDFKDARVVTLEQNYRSTPPILEAAHKVIRNNKTRKPKQLWTRQQGGETIRVQELPNEMEEASWVVRMIEAQLARGRQLREFSIFYRTNAQSRSFEEALRRAGLPYRIVGAMRFYERKEIKDALCYARALLNPADSASLERIVNVPARGIGQTSLERLRGFALACGLTLNEAFRRQQRIPGLTPACRRRVTELLSLLDALREELPRLSASAALARILEGSGLWAQLESETETDPEAAGRLANLQELLNAVKEYEDKAKLSGQALDLGSYLEAVSLQSDLDSYDSAQAGVTLMTVHLAKGLEFPVVFLTGLEEGLFPIASGNARAEDLEEERRLCYVGITRARELLYMTHAATRRIFGQVYANLPSRFILESQLAREGWGASPNAAARALPRFAAGAERVGSFRSGQRVRHPSFGLGRVADVSGCGEALKVTVRFDDGRVTKLLARYAPLESA